MRKQTVEDRRDVLFNLGQALVQIAETVKALDSKYPNNDRHLAVRMLQATIREIRGPAPLQTTFSRIIYSGIKEPTTWVEVPLDQAVPVEEDF